MIDKLTILAPGTRLRITDACDVVPWIGHTVFVVTHYPSRAAGICVMFEGHGTIPFWLSHHEVELIQPTEG